MRKEVKDTIIVELGEKLKEFPHFYLVDVAGLNAADTSDLRRKCFKNEIKMVVVKNTLLRKAFENSEIDYEPLYTSLKGSTAMMFCKTANVPAKLLKEYKDKKKEIPDSAIQEVISWWETTVSRLRSELTTPEANKALKQLLKHNIIFFKKTRPSLAARFEQLSNSIK